jgi:hypothetical protein
MDQVSDDLQDTSETRWTAANKIVYLNEALHQLLAVKPEAFATQKSFQLTANGTYQTIPAGDTQLIRLVKNMGSNGTTVGKVITPISMEEMDLLNSLWHKKTGQTYIDHYAYDRDKSKTIFYVYPRPHATTAVYVEGIVASPHTAVTAGNETTNLGLADEYEQFLKDMIKRYAYLKETSIESVQKAGAYEAAAYTSIGLLKQAEMAIKATRERRQ